jgi:Ca2+:H+ antiporter
MNYNPFARQRARDHLYDEENLTQTRSEAGRVPTIEEQRRLEEREAAKEHGAPHYLPTEPTYTPADAPEIITGNGLIRDGWDSTVVGFSEETTPHVSSTESTEGVKKRSKFKKPFRGHNDLDDEALANGSSENLSWEERKQKALKRKIPVGQQFRFIVFHEWAYVGLLAFIPTGFALYYTHVNVVAVFCVNFIAIIPSAAMLSNAVGELSIRLGDNMCALLNMTFG